MRIEQGETLAQIAAEHEATAEARMAEHRQAALAAPEPKDKLSAEWRYWQIRQITHAFNTRTEPGYTEARRKVRTLIMGLVADEDFWRGDLLLPLLGHLFCARQEIDEIRLHKQPHGKTEQPRRAKQATKR
jgi:hypothetical protein